MLGKQEAPPYLESQNQVTADPTLTKILFLCCTIIAFEHICSIPLFSLLYEHVAPISCGYEIIFMSSLQSLVLSLLIGRVNYTAYRV